MMSELGRRVNKIWRRLSRDKSLLNSTDVSIEIFLVHFFLKEVTAKLGLVYKLDIACAKQTRSYYIKN